MKKLMTWVLCAVKKLVVAMMCLMMCFSTVVGFGTPVTALAKSKCAHKHTQWVKLVNTTCTKDGKTACV